MSDAKQLDESIRDLHSQIDTLNPDDYRAGHLRSLADDVQRTIGTSATIKAPENVGERITASILQFEITHPRIALVLNEIAEKLSNIGI